MTDPLKKYRPQKTQGFAGSIGKTPKKRPLQRRHTPAYCRVSFGHLSPARPRDADPLPCSPRSISWNFPDSHFCVAISISSLRKQANERI